MDRAAARAMKEREESFNPFVTCYETAGCQKLDMNLVCNTNLTVAGDTGKCECRHDMRWNEKSGECQLYLVESLNCNIDTVILHIWRKHIDMSPRFVDKCATIYHVGTCLNTILAMILSLKTQTKR